MKLRVEIIKDSEGFLALEAVWNPLLGRSGADSLFLTYEWLYTCLAHLKYAKQLFIVVVWNEQAVVAIAPLMVNKREGLRQLCSISNDIVVSDYKDFIIDDSANREQVIREIFDALFQDDGWDFFRLDRFPTDSVNFLAFNSVLAQYPPNRVVRKEQVPTLYIPLEGTFDEYFQSLKKSFRIDVAKWQRRMEKLPYSFSDEIDSSKISETVGEIIDLKADSLKAKKDDGEKTMYDDPSIRPFFIDFAKKAYSLGWLRISTLLINDENASRFIDFQYKNKCYRIIPWYNPNYSRCSPSNLISMRQIKHCFELELSECDLLGGIYDYKFNYNVKVREKHEIFLFRGGLKGRLARLRIFNTLIPMLRKFYWLCGANLRRIPYMNEIIDATKKYLQKPG